MGAEKIAATWPMTTTVGIKFICTKLFGSIIMVGFLKC